jgi:CHAD domain-containing protein
MIHTLDFEAKTRPTPTKLHTFLLRSLKDQWRDYRSDFARCRRKFSEKSVHRFRVESRRLLSTLSVLAAVTPGKPLKAAIRGVKKRLRYFARLRDTHVQLLAVEDLERKFPELEDFRRALAKREKRLTKRVARKLKHAGLRGVARPIKAVRRELRTLMRNRGRDEKDMGAVTEALDETFNTVTKRLRAVDSTNPVTIHRTRIAFKKFRYMMEALQPLLRGVNDRVIKRMQEYQDRMGAIQDATVLRSSLEKFLGRHRHRAIDATRICPQLERRSWVLIASFASHADELYDFAPPSGPQPIASPTRTTKRH